MIVLVDDIKLNDRDVFFNYINTMFPDDEIVDEESLFNFLTKGNPQIEFLISDYDDVSDDGKFFASRILRLLNDVLAANNNFKLTMM